MSAVVQVRVAPLLRSYTGGDGVVEVEAADLAQVMDALDTRFPGISFRVVDEQGRIRPHMSVFVGQERAGDLATPVPAGQDVTIVGALSGG